MHAHCDRPAKVRHELAMMDTNVSKASKVHMVIDTLGHLLTVQVRAANE